MRLLLCYWSSALVFSMLRATLPELPAYHGPIAEWVTAANQATSQIVKLVCAKYPISLCAQGGEMMDCVHLVKLGFETKEPMTKERARQVVVGITEIALEQYNSNRTLRPYLEQFPFQPSNLQIDLFLRKARSRAGADDPLIIVGLDSGRVSFIYEDRNEPHKWVTVSESYEEALRIVQSQTSPSLCTNNR